MTNHPTFLGAEKMGARIAEEYNDGHVRVIPHARATRS